MKEGTCKVYEDGKHLWTEGGKSRDDAMCAAIEQHDPSQYWDDHSLYLSGYSAAVTPFQD